MGELIRHKTHIDYDGDYDIALFEQRLLAKELSKIEGLVVLSLERAPETGYGGGASETLGLYLEFKEEITILLNHPLSNFMMAYLGGKITDHLYKKLKTKFKKKSFLKNYEIGETIVFQYKNNFFICNPQMRIKTFKRAASSIHKNQQQFCNKDTTLKHFLFWNEKRRQWETLYKIER